MFVTEMSDAMDNLVQTTAHTPYNAYAKNIKMIRNRLNGLAATIGSERIKNDSFLKCKAKLKTEMERNL